MMAIEFKTESTMGTTKNVKINTIQRMNNLTISH